MNGRRTHACKMETEEGRIAIAVLFQQKEEGD